MVLTYSGRSKPSAERIAWEGGIEIVRGNHGDINWGRATAQTTLNPDISNSTNKRIMRELFKEHGVPMPRLYPKELYLASAYEALQEGKWLVGRPDQHTKGRGFWLVKTPQDLYKSSRGWKIFAPERNRFVKSRKKPATHWMEYIEADHEYRVHIFRGKSIRISEKSFFTGEDGRRAYTTIKPTGEVGHVRKAAKQAVEALGLDFGAVDILANDDKCWVLEVNAAPGLGGSMPRLYADTFKRWYEGEL